MEAGIKAKGFEPDEHASENSAVVRRMQRADLRPALVIEREAFARPWSQAMFLTEVEKPGSICLVATEDERLVGYLIATHYPDAWHLMTIAVADDRRRHGIGGMMIERLLEEMGEAGSLTLEVRPSNQAAVSMYERFGLKVVGRRRGYYSDNREDALIMWRVPKSVET